MSLCGRPPYQKGSSKKKSKDPTAEQRAQWEVIRELGCILRPMGVRHVCQGRITIHHLFTGAGGRKNHDLVAPLCVEMHTGYNGIDGRRNYSKKKWQEKFATEQQMFDKVNELLNCHIDSK